MKIEDELREIVGNNPDKIEEVMRIVRRGRHTTYRQGLRAEDLKLYNLLKNDSQLDMSLQQLAVASGYGEGDTNASQKVCNALGRLLKAGMLKTNDEA